MLTLNEMLPSRFLKQIDVLEPLLLTISDIKKEVIDKDSGERKPCMYFAELEKPLVLNSTNVKRVASIYGSEPSKWISEKIVLFCDPEIEYAGKVVGGLRLRAPKNKPKTKKSEAPAPGETESADDGASTRADQ